MITFIIGVFVGICIGGYAGWEMKKSSNMVNVTVNLDAQDLIDIKESEDELDNLKNELNLK